MACRTLIQVLHPLIHVTNGLNMPKLLQKHWTIPWFRFEVLSHFSEDVLCFEHGLPDLAPFLGREFRGLQGARGYFELIGELLDFQDMSFSVTRLQAVKA